MERDEIKVNAGSLRELLNCGENIFFNISRIAYFGLLCLDYCALVLNFDFIKCILYRERPFISCSDLLSVRTSKP